MSGIPEEKRDNIYADTMEALRQAERALPDFTSSYDGEIRRLYEQIATRPAFHYDPGADPLYQSYRAQAVSEGGRAMRDTMGQAAALTGGYGSSYAQSVGQQQYGLYLEKLGRMMPEFYGAAYERYQKEGSALQKQLDTASGLAQAEYSRSRDRFRDAAALEQQRYERGQKDLDRAGKDLDRALKRQQNLISLISKSGYVPTDEELTASGLTRSQAEALRSSYLQDNPVALMLSGGWPTGGSGSGGGGNTGGGGTGSSGSAEAGTKEKIKLAAAKSGSGSGKKRRL